MVRLNPLALSILLVPCIGLGAQRPVLGPIDTDRPDFTDGTATVARGHSQFELGYTRTLGRTDTDAPRVQQVQEGLFRVGLTSRVEFRLSQNFVTITPNTPTPRNLTGFDDLGLGTKISLSEQHRALPSLSFEAGSRLPTGGRSVAARKFLPSAALLFGWEGSGPWSMGSELAGERTPDDHFQVDASVSVQYAVLDQLQLYGEWYTFQTVNGGPGNAGEHYANSGILYRLSNNTQIDARLGVGLNQAANKSFFGIGFSFRR
jgi:hypothetical protein